MVKLFIFFFSIGNRKRIKDLPSSRYGPAWAGVTSSASTRRRQDVSMSQVYFMSRIRNEKRKLNERWLLRVSRWGGASSVTGGKLPENERRSRRGANINAETPPFPTSMRPVYRPPSFSYFPTSTLLVNDNKIIMFDIASRFLRQTITVCKRGPNRNEVTR